MEECRVIDEDALVKMIEEFLTNDDPIQPLMIITNGMTEEQIKHIKDIYNIKE